MAEAEARQAAARAAPSRPESTGGACTGLHGATHLSHLSHFDSCVSCIKLSFCQTTPLRASAWVCTLCTNRHSMQYMAASWQHLPDLRSEVPWQAGPVRQPCLPRQQMLEPHSMSCRVVHQPLATQCLSPHRLPTHLPAGRRITDSVQGRAALSDPHMACRVSPWPLPAAVPFCAAGAWVKAVLQGVANELPWRWGHLLQPSA